ncbi:MAG: hypothetical protein WCQ99_12945 [Pseudomonadota bacterium]
MPTKKKLIEGLLFFLCGSAFFCLLVFVVTRWFDGRMPVLGEFLPMVSLTLVSIFVVFRE